MPEKTPDGLRHLYTIFCDDVRFEAAGRISMMGVLTGLTLAHFPMTVFKFAVVTSWAGEGRHTTQVRIMPPHSGGPLAASQEMSFTVSEGGHAQNVSMFLNLTFPAPGTYVVQTLIDSRVVSEAVLPVEQAADAASAAVN